MKVRVLGCSGAIAKDCRTTSFLIDSELLIDAGTGVGDLSLAQMRAVDHVMLTHSHLDHIAALPLMVDAVASQRSQPLMVYGLAGTLDALRTHIFNDVIWPDFTRIPSPEAPFLRLREISLGQVLAINDKQVEVLPAVHTVAACGYAVSASGPSWVFTGDTERTPAFWKRLHQLKIGMLVIETAFSNREKELAQRSLHLSPLSLAQELEQIDPSRDYPIYITHTKPAETGQIMSEIQRLDGSDGSGIHPRHDIRWLFAGQEFEL